MSAKNSHTTPPTALLKHLDRVYEMARVLAPTEKRASKLVEATYRRAAQSTPPETGTVRAWLFRLLLQTYATRRSDAATTSSVSTMRRPADLLQDFRFQTAEDALQRVVPVAFALRSPREQLVLTLCDIVELGLDEAAVVLDTEPDALADEVAAAREALWKAARAELTRGERTLVEEELSTNALLDALRRVIAPHLGPLPPTLRPSVAALIEHPSAAADDDPFDASDDHPDAPVAEPFSSRPPPAADGGGFRLGRRLQRFGTALLIVLVTGLAGYLVADLLPSNDEPAATDLLRLSVQHADDVRPGLQTSSAEEAAQFVLDRLGRRIAVPTIEEATLSGVSIVELDADTRVPVFVFDDNASDQRITTYAYTYAVLDRLGDRVRLTRELRQQLQDEEHITLQTMDDSGVLVWRKRDDIYVAVTKADPRRVRPRIAHSS